MPQNLEKKVDKILVEVLSNREDIKDLKREVGNMSKKMDQVLNTVDSFAKKVEVV